LEEEASKERAPRRGERSDAAVERVETDGVMGVRAQI